MLQWFRVWFGFGKLGSECCLHLTGVGYNLREKKIIHWVCFLVGIIDIIVVHISFGFYKDWKQAFHFKMESKTVVTNQYNSANGMYLRTKTLSMLYRHSSAWLIIILSQKYSFFHKELSIYPIKMFSYIPVLIKEIFKI